MSEDENEPRVLPGDGWVVTHWIQKEGYSEYSEDRPVLYIEIDRYSMGALFYALRRDGVVDAFDPRDHAGDVNWAVWRTDISLARVARRP
jgi:hypothetical protein